MAVLRFVLLGPLEVRVDDTPVNLGPVKQRLFAATLLLDPNEVLRTDHLAEMLWGQPRPASAAANLRTYAHGLRRALRTAPGAPTRLHTRTGGYLLEVRPGERDLDEFQEAAHRGRAALAAGNLESAETSLGTALRMWREPALADLPLPPTLAGRLARLAEQRLIVEEDHVQARLGLGGAAELVGRLRETVAAHPLRQRSWAQLMTALYRTGDVAGAVAAYLHARQALAEQTGLDPSPELQALYRDVLHHSPQLAADRPGTDTTGIVAAARTPPRELPARIDGLVGRRSAIATALAWLDGPARPAVVALHGPGGVGKSALAVHLAAELADRYPGGTLYVDLQGSDANLPPLRPVDVLGRFLRTLGMPGNAVPADPGEATACFRSTVAGRGMLVVLDNARDAAQVRPLLPGDESCTTLVTSRRILATLPHSRHLAVELLSREAAVRLLAAECGAERVAAQPEQADRLAELCGLLPLALRIVGARLASRPQWPLDRLVARLTDPRHRLDELEYDDLSLRASIQHAYAALTGGDERDRRGARILRLVGGTRLPVVSARAVAALLGEPVAVAEDTLELLADQRLVEPRRPGTYAIHDLLRLFAAERAQDEPTADLEAALGRLTQLYQLGSRDVTRLANAGWSPTAGSEPPAPAWQESPTTPEQAARWLAEEHANIVAAFTQAAEGGPATARLAALLAWSSAAALRRHGYRHEAVRLIDGAATLTDTLGLPLEHAAALFYRASLNRGTGDPSRVEADLLRCLELVRSLDDRDRISACLEALGVLHYRTGALDRSLAHHDEALALRRASGKPLLVGASLSNSAQVRMAVGAQEEAFAGVEEALRIAREIGAVGLEGAALSMWGQLLCLAGRWTEALPVLTEAVAVTERAGDLPSRSEAHLARTAAHLRLADPVSAARDAAEAGDLAARFGDRYVLAVARHAAARAAEATGDCEAAGRSTAEARELLRSLPGYREPHYELFFGPFAAR
ncbi:DNA-binding transcriptional activator of the SARP family [Micromonospora nigra]|uniref:DNA-binding transcriptional activator of the SARP family n=1 Tax=Micromonospora nigra TaxID=145857 RepID=A0A1C6RA55_9ACTN|nr:BTAD domain-containing putative transcriptional regulator [Micromonospora nigra]SCL13841.1 DNA-binding transcriptional activator of the SARP family [Micromonospora nigra]